MGRLRGIRRTATSWQVFARVHGRFVSKRFPLDTKLNLERERQRLIGRVLDARPSEEAERSRFFHEDADAYLDMVTGMPSYEDRRYHIGQWKAAFTGRTRGSIHARDIRAVLEQWRTNKHKKLSHGSLNRRRTALMHLYTTLDGRSAPNIVKDVEPYSEAYSEIARAWPMAELVTLIHRMPESDSKTRLRVLLWTGWPSALLKAVQPADVDWKGKRVRLQPRQKGHGMVEAWVPILPPAVTALRMFKARALWGPFSNSSLHKALQRALKSASHTRKLRVYDLRHSFGTWAAAHLKDDKALSELLRTQSIGRYTRQAVADRLVTARNTLQVAMATSGAGFAPLRSRRKKAKAKTR